MGISIQDIGTFNLFRNCRFKIGDKVEFNLDLHQWYYDFHVKPYVKEGHNGVFTITDITLEDGDYMLFFDDDGDRITACYWRVMPVKAQMSLPFK